MNRWLWTAFGTAFVVAVAFLNGCGSSSSSSMTISGTLSAASGRTAETLRDFTGYSVRCTTLSGTPTAGEGTVDPSAGTFTLSLSNPDNAPFGCFVLSGTDIVAVMAFASSTTGIDGDTVTSGNFIADAGSSGIALGTVSLDLTKGKATVDTTKVVQTGGSGTSSTAGGTWTDPTGSWVISATPGAVPTGYSAVCAAGADKCDGPTAGETIYLHQYTATDASSATHYGLAVWGSSTAYASCGSAEGVTLPAGWTAGQAALTSPMTVSTSLPDPSTITNTMTACGASSAAACNTITNVQSWGDGTHTFTNAQCQFLCAMNGIWPFMESGSACYGRFFVDWNNFNVALHSATPSYSSGWSGIGTANTSNPDVTTYLNGSIQFGMHPKNRYIMNEAVISGNVATLFDHQGETQGACSAYDASNNCSGSPISCGVFRNTKLTITQTSATTATAELVQQSQVPANDPNYSTCVNDQWIKSELGSRYFMFVLTKQ